MFGAAQCSAGFVNWTPTETYIGDALRERRRTVLGFPYAIYTAQNLSAQAGHVAGYGENKSAYRVITRKSNGKKPPGRSGPRYKDAVAYSGMWRRIIQ